MINRSIQNQSQLFFADADGTNTLRLNFSNSSPERIEEGVRRLAALVRSRLG